MASTMMTLNSSLISDMKPEICFMRRSTEASFPVYQNLIRHRVIIVLHTNLEQSGDGIGCYTPIRVCDQILEIDVASGDTSRVL